VNESKARQKISWVKNPTHRSWDIPKTYFSTPFKRSPLYALSPCASAGEKTFNVII
jgi:hypothetical protein